VQKREVNFVSKTVIEIQAFEVRIDELLD